MIISLRFIGSITFTSLIPDAHQCMRQQYDNALKVR